MSQEKLNVSNLEVKAVKDSFTEPRPNRAIMRASSLLSEWFLLQGIPILRTIPLVRETPLVGGYFKVSDVVIPEADSARLKVATDPRNVFFIGPNHPEFTTDWLLDKYISHRYAPEVSSWAAASIINGPLKPFWMANNLIGNNGGERAKRYSVESALQGKGTLLHPEGTVRWRSDKIFDLLPGIVDMSCDAVQKLKTERITRDVLIIPIIWKLTYNDSIEPSLNRALASLETRLQLPNNSSLSTAARYVELQKNLLTVQMKRFAYKGPITPSSLPRSARDFFDSLLDQLAAKYSIDIESQNVHRSIHRLYRAAKDARDKQDALKVEELQRLASYSPETFERDHFFQEEIAEGIQFLRQIFFTKGYDAVRASLPKPFGWRTANIRVPQPINVGNFLAAYPNDTEAPTQLLAKLQACMVDALRVLNLECPSNRTLVR